MVVNLTVPMVSKSRPWGSGPLSLAGLVAISTNEFFAVNDQTAQGLPS